MGHSLKELERLSGVGRAAIRHYVRRRMLPSATARGPDRGYGEVHVHTLRAITALRRQGFRGARLAARLEISSPEDIRALAGVPSPTPSPVVEPIASAPPRSDASLREAIDALVCVAAEVLDISPRSVRPALAAVFARMHGAQLSAEDATRVMLPG